MRVWTIGHSDRPLDEFVALLAAHRITLVADVRSVPKSRHSPQFSIEVLPASLAAHGIGYRHFRGLGGWRHARSDSPNGGWRNASFRGYADYMLTPAFAEALGELIAASSEQPTAIMCAEAVPWRCHRSLIADALVVRGIEVCDIIGAGEAREHKLTSFAVVEGDVLAYPPEGA